MTPQLNLADSLVSAAGRVYFISDGVRQQFPNYLLSDKPMKIWEVILAEDRKSDLTQSGVYPDWYHSLFTSWKPPTINADGTVDDAEEFPGPLGLLPFSAAWESADDELWAPQVEGMWVERVRSLRYAAKQVRKTRTRPPGIDPTTARGVWAACVGALRLTLPLGDRPFRGYRPIPAPGGAVARDIWVTLNDRQRELVTSIDALFQAAFASLAEGLENVPFCHDCHRALPISSPTGRPSKATMCQKCAEARWRARKGVEGVRAQWRKNKRDEREEARRQGEN
jgi:hypothetical protein